MTTRRRRIQATTRCATIVALAVAFPALADEDDEPDGLRFGLEADLEFAHETVGREGSTEITFDEVGLSAEASWWQAEAGLKYESDGGKLLVEDASLFVGGTADWPLVIGVGRMVLPFGEYPSDFVEDPVTALLGEQDATAVIVGLETGTLFLSSGLLEAERRSDPALVTSARLEFAEDLFAGLSWASDLRESVELRELREDLLDEWEGDVPEADDSLVSALSGFVLREGEAWSASAEFVAALEKLPAAELLDDRARRSHAWTIEVSTSLLEGWRAAVRYERTKDFPTVPEWQSGGALIHEIAERWTLAADYLHGRLEDGTARDVVSAQLGFEY